MAQRSSWLLRESHHDWNIWQGDPCWAERSNCDCGCFLQSVSLTYNDLPPFPSQVSVRLEYRCKWHVSFMAKQLLSNTFWWLLMVWWFPKFCLLKVELNKHIPQTPFYPGYWQVTSVERELPFCWYRIVVKITKSSLHSSHSTQATLTFSPRKAAAYDSSHSSNLPTEKMS